MFGCLGGQLRMEEEKETKRNITFIRLDIYNYFLELIIKITAKFEFLKVRFWSKRSTGCYLIQSKKI